MPLEGGTPQGDPASPAIWVCVVDFALAWARQYGGEGVDVGSTSFFGGIYLLYYGISQLQARVRTSPSTIASSRSRA